MIVEDNRVASHAWLEGGDINDADLTDTDLVRTHTHRLLSELARPS